MTVVFPSSRCMPIIFISSQFDISMAVRAMKAGAMEVLTKPLVANQFVSAIRAAIDRSYAILGQPAKIQELPNRYASLSSRERQVMALVVSGLLNKQVGSMLEISEITVKAHRGKMMRKMRAGSLPDLVRMAERLDLTAAMNGSRPDAPLFSSSRRPTPRYQPTLGPSHAFLP